MTKSLREIINSSEFINGVELLTARGLLQVEGKKSLESANEMMSSGIFDFISITDNAGGNPQIAPETMGRSLLQKGYNVNIHVTCKDRNRDSLELRGWHLASEGFNNILALTGDYPVSGYKGIGRPVFDIDSVGLIKMYSDMNKGLEVPGRKKGTTIKFSKTDFFIAATVSPFKKYEAEYLTQLYKMEKKVQAGAEYFIIQVGYDSRKWSELLTYAGMKNINTPFIANIYLLSKVVARMFNQGIIPGCNVSDELLEIVKKQAESEDKGKAYFIELAAKQWAIAKGLGFKGVYISGVHSLDTLLKIKKNVDGFKEDDWISFYREFQYPLKDEFYLFKQDEETKLAVEEYNDKYIRSRKPLARFVKRIFITPPIYGLSRIVHFFIFNKRSPFYHLLRLFYRLIDKSDFLCRFFHLFEHFGKRVLYGCHDCGDCSLIDVAYLCPEEKCSKNQRNGPCGGSYMGKCEVDDKKCIWVRAYKRLKLFGAEKKNFNRGIVFTDGKLLHTSGWLNFFLNRDHTSRMDK